MTTLQSDFGISKQMEEIRRGRQFMLAAGATVFSNIFVAVCGTKSIDMAAKQGAFTDFGAAAASVSPALFTFASYKFFMAFYKAVETAEPINAGILARKMKPTIFDAILATTLAAVNVPFYNDVQEHNKIGRVEQAAIANRQFIDKHAPSGVGDRRVGEIFCKEPGIMGAYYRGLRPATVAEKSYKVNCP